MTSTVGPIDVEERRPVFFDFSSELLPNETLAAVTAVEVTVQSGTDPTPLNILVGSASISGTMVQQMVKGGVQGASYHLRAIAVSSLSSTLVVAANLRVVSL